VLVEHTAVALVIGTEDCAAAPLVVGPSLAEDYDIVATRVVDIAGNAAVAVKLPALEKDAAKADCCCSFALVMRISHGAAAAHATSLDQIPFWGLGGKCVSVVNERMCSRGTANRK